MKKSGGSAVAEAEEIDARLINDDEFQGESMPAYQEVLTFCLSHLGQAVEWPTGHKLTHEAARRIQNGFHSSGLGRRLRGTHIVRTKIVNRGAGKDGGYKIQIRVREKNDTDVKAEGLKARFPRNGNRRSAVSRARRMPKTA